MPLDSATPDVGRGERRGVVDPVADEQRLWPRPVASFDGGALVVRQQSGRGLAGRAAARSARVAGQHLDRQPEPRERPRASRGAESRSRSASTATATSSPSSGDVDAVAGGLELPGASARSRRDRD